MISRFILRGFYSIYGRYKKFTKAAWNIIKFDVNHNINKVIDFFQTMLWKPVL